MYYKVWFERADQSERTAALIFNTELRPIGLLRMADYSRFYPYSEARKMERFHVSPLYTTWQEAFEAEL